MKSLTAVLISASVVLFAGCSHKEDGATSRLMEGAPANEAVSTAAVPVSSVSYLATAEVRVYDDHGPTSAFYKLRFTIVDGIKVQNVAANRTYGGNTTALRGPGSGDFITDSIISFGFPTHQYFVVDMQKRKVVSTGGSGNPDYTILASDVVISPTPQPQPTPIPPGRQTSH